MIRMLNFQPMELGGGVGLRALQKSDAPELYRLANSNRAHLRQWLPWIDDVKAREDIERFVDLMLLQMQNSGGIQVVIRADSSLAGMIGLHGLEWQNQCTKIGYWLAAEFEGRGMMTTACRAMVDYVFSEVGLHRVEIRCATGNLRSCAIPERLGFKFEGIAREAEWLYDHFVDVKIYSVLKHEWHL